MILFKISRVLKKKKTRKHRGNNGKRKDPRENENGKERGIMGEDVKNATEMHEFVVQQIQIFLKQKLS